MTTPVPSGDQARRAWAAIRACVICDWTAYDAVLGECSDDTRELIAAISMIAALQLRPPGGSWADVAAQVDRKLASIAGLPDADDTP